MHASPTFVIFCGSFRLRQYCLGTDDRSASFLETGMPYTKKIFLAFV